MSFYRKVYLSTGLLEKTVKEKGLSFAAKRYERAEEAQNAPVPFTTYSLFINGKFITHEIIAQNKFIKLLEAHD